jgi:hypothetical protein
MTFRQHVITLGALACLLACQASSRSASQPQSSRISSSHSTCDDQAARFSPSADPVFLGDFLYTCRLEQAYLDLVAPRRACSTTTDCIFIAGSNVLPAVFINRLHEKYVSVVRDKTSEAEGFVVSKSQCGGIGPAPQPACIGGLCQAKPVDDCGAHQAVEAEGRASL